LKILVPFDFNVYPTKRQIAVTDSVKTANLFLFAGFQSVVRDVWSPNGEIEIFLVGKRMTQSLELTSCSPNSGWRAILLDSHEYLVLAVPNIDDRVNIDLGVGETHVRPKIYQPDIG